MSILSRLFLGLGALNAMLAVLFGAFGAHALRTRLTPEMLAVYHTGVEYHFYHALGLLVLALLLAHFPEQGGFQWAAWLMLTGIILFSGSLYLLSLTEIRVLGAITPLGGVALLVAWGIVALTAWRMP